MISWDDSMATGLPDLDVQHKKIIEKFNEFSQAIADGTGRAVAGDILDFLQFYAVWHFEREEKCMEQYKCPAAEKNKKAHAEFVTKFGQFYEQWQESSMSIELIQVTFLELEKWIVNHIRGVDSQLHPCVRKMG